MLKLLERSRAEKRLEDKKKLVPDANVKQSFAERSAISSQKKNQSKTKKNG
jgi:hypothetical protein